MTGRDFERPQEGERLDIRLLRRVTMHAFDCLVNRHTRPLSIKLANKGGAMPYVTMRHGQMQPMVHFYDPAEGHEITKRTVPLFQYVVANAFGRR